MNSIDCIRPYGQHLNLNYNSLVLNVCQVFQAIGGDQFENIELVPQRLTKQFFLLFFGLICSGGGYGGACRIFSLLCEVLFHLNLILRLRGLRETKA